jgi:hypothetical protein
MKRNKRVVSPDNWWPTADDGMVSVSLHQDQGKGSARWRVAVWGDDDFGLEMGELDITTAFNVFNRIHDGVSQSALRKRGFVAA